VPALRRHLVEYPEHYMTGRLLPGRQMSRRFLEATAFFFVFPDLVAEVPFRGDYSPYINRFMFTSTPDDRGVVVNMLRARNVDGTRSDDLTRATVDLYRNLVPLVDFFRRRIPGFACCSLCDSEPEIQLRETRRIAGDYVLAASDVVEGRSEATLSTSTAPPIRAGCGSCSNDRTESPIGPFSHRGSRT